MGIRFEDWSLGITGVLVGWRFFYTYPFYHNIDDGYLERGPWVQYISIPFEFWTSRYSCYVIINFIFC
jgi:hypothetical protein